MKQILFIILTLLLLVSCKKDKTEPVAVVDPITVPEPEPEECFVNKVTYVTSVDAPNSGTINTPVQIDVSHQLTNGCLQTSKFIESANGNTQTIEVETKYVGCACPQNAPIHTSQYEFLATTSGIYTLKFKSSVTDYIEVDLEINE